MYANDTIIPNNAQYDGQTRVYSRLCLKTRIQSLWCCKQNYSRSLQAQCDAIPVSRIVTHHWQQFYLWSIIEATNVTVHAAEYILKLFMEMFAIDPISWLKVRNVAIRFIVVMRFRCLCSLLLIIAGRRDPTRRLIWSP